jgi:hypothetical protein
MVRSPVSRIVLFLTVTLAMIPGCNDSGTGPGTGAVNFGTLAGGTAKLLDTYVGGNAGILGSLSVYLPDIQEALAAAAPAGARLNAAPAQTCIASSLVGKVFDFDGSSYVDTGETGPADGVRFLLRGAPTVSNPPAEPVGHVDIVCGSALPSVDLTVTLVSNAVTVVELGMSGLYSTYPTLTLDGFYASGDGSVKLPIRSGQLNGGLSVQTAFEFLVLPDLTAGYRVTKGASGNVQALFNAREGLGTPKWNLDVTVSESTAGPSAQGTAVYKGELVACISGNIDSPVVEDPEDAGCSLPDTPVGSVSRADRQAMRDAYVALRILHGYLQFLADLGLGAVAVPA